MEHAMSAMHPNMPHGAGLIWMHLGYYKYLVEKHACDERFLHMAKALGKTDMPAGAGTSRHESRLLHAAALTQSLPVSFQKRSSPSGKIPGHWDGFHLPYSIPWSLLQTVWRHPEILHDIPFSYI